MTGDEVVWRTVQYLEKPDETFEYELVLPQPLASWDVFGCWERERVHSMRDHLKPGMVLYDVGAEQGWQSIVYATMVGPENMVLIEPSPEFWPNIKATWERNYASPPKAVFDGLFSDQSTDLLTLEGRRFNVWPKASDGPLIDRNKYQYIHEHADEVRQIRLDDFVAASRVVPQAITIDVEGAELLVLKGAAETLAARHPLVWVSIHPDLMAKDYNTTPAELYEFMANFGYTGTHLATDHEQHWLFR